MDADPLKRNGDNEVIRPEVVLRAPEQHAALGSPLETPPSNLAIRCGRH